MYKYFFKRILDFLGALILLILVSPVMIWAYFKIKKELGEPVFFTQKRPGLHGKIFKIYKFRTMSDERDEKGELLPDELRLKDFGKKLRGSSIDELPQLFNVLKGDMSFIGPRPLLVEYLDLYTPEQMRRHDVAPGISGWAQVNGRNTLSWEEKFAYDVYYVDNLSLKLDCKIFFMTVMNVLKQDGINSDNANTMEKFTGTEAEEVHR